MLLLLLLLHCLPRLRSLQYVVTAVSRSRHILISIYLAQNLTLAVGTILSYTGGCRAWVEWLPGWMNQNW